VDFSEMVGERMIYHRKEGGLIRYRQIGVQWWHGPIVFWRTAFAVYRWSLGWKDVRDGYLYEKDDFTIEDYVQQQQAIQKIPREAVPLMEFFR